jgi:hypothetical protein
MLLQNSYINFLVSQGTEILISFDAGIELKRVEYL